MRRWMATVGLVAGLLAPDPAGAQVLRAAAGAGGGAAAGVVVTLGWVVQRATFEEQYLHSMRDLIGVTGTPLLLGPAIGLTLALADEDRFRSAAVGASAGTLFGAALGAGLGELLAGDRTARWAGGVMGAAAGLLVGAAIGTLDDPGGSDGADAAAGGIPLGLTLRF